MQVRYGRLYMRSGIYRIKCHKNNTVYVGQARNLSNRTAAHRQMLRKGTHYNRHMQCAYNKHGEESFSTAYLMHCDADNLTWHEQRILDIYSRRFKVCNSAAPVDTPMLGRKRVDGHKGTATLDKYRGKAHQVLSEKLENDPEFLAFRQDIGRRATKCLRSDASIEAKRKQKAAESQRNPKLRAKRSMQIKARFAAGWQPLRNPNKTKIIDTNTGTVYESYTRAAMEFGVAVPTVYKWVNGRTDGRSKNISGKPNWRLYDKENV